MIIRMVGIVHRTTRGWSNGVVFLVFRVMPKAKGGFGGGGGGGRKL